MGLVTQKQADDFGVLNPLLVAMYEEFQELSKKKAQCAVSKNKVTIVNRMLTPVLGLLDNEPSRVFLNLLDEDDLPENSDVALMLGQAIAAMQSFRARYATTFGDWSIGQ